jgi:hypothetical protein
VDSIRFAWIRFETSGFVRFAWIRFETSGFVEIRLDSL